MENKLRNYMDSYTEQWPINVAVRVAKGEKVLYNQAFGLANIQHQVENKVETKFWLASITKLFTATAIMILQERGLLNTMDAINSYLPEYPEFDGRISIHHLLTHTSGIINYNEIPEWDEKVKRLFYQEADFIALFKNEPLKFEPGAAYDYSNSGYYQACNWSTI
jgi:CubicO group peptidase (beta-lactamase class C family)